MGKNKTFDLRNLTENKSLKAINICVGENKLAKAKETTRFFYTKKDKKLVIIYQNSLVPRWKSFSSFNIQAN